MPRISIKPMGPWEFGWRPPEPRKTAGPCPCGVNHDRYFGDLAGREDIDPRGPRTTKESTST